MPPFLASNFSNLYEFLVGGPIMLVALVAGAVGLAARIRPLALASAVACFAIAMWFLVSLEKATAADTPLTLTVATIAVLSGCTFLLLKRTRGDSQKPGPAQDS